MDFKEFQILHPFYGGCRVDLFAGHTWRSIRLWCLLSLYSRDLANGWNLSRLTQWPSRNILRSTHCNNILQQYSIATPQPSNNITPTYNCSCLRSRPRWSWPSNRDGRSLREAAFTLRTGARMPVVGFGTWRLWAKAAYEPVRWALEAGYRHLDTAEGYANEAEIGRAIADSGIPREEIFIATKASSIPKGLTDMAYAGDVFAFQLSQLGTDYVDLYMLHTPPPEPAQLQALWAIMEGFFEEGRARALGISNCDVKELEFLLSFARIAPAYVQNLFKVYKPGEQIPNNDVVAFAQANGMVVMGYSVQTEWPHIMSPLEDPHVLAIAASVGRSASQVLHRWALQRGVGVIPKSATKARIFENARLFDFEILSCIPEGNRSNRPNKRSRSCRIGNSGENFPMFPDLTTQKTAVSVLQTSKLCQPRLNEAAMRVLDGLATLSESGPGQVKPYAQEERGFIQEKPLGCTHLYSFPMQLSSAAPVTVPFAGEDIFSLSRLSHAAWHFDRQIWTRQKTGTTHHQNI